MTRPEIAIQISKILVHSLRTVPRFLKIKIMEKVMVGFTGHQRVMV